MSVIKGQVAIIGQTNVGKSTLFNLLTHSRTSIVSDEAGVTRDRIQGIAYYDREKTDGFMLVDTGGYETKDYNFQPFKDNIVWRQSESAINQADLILYVFDNQAGVHQLDRDLLRKLQDKGKPILYIINKVDGLEKTPESWEFYSLGIKADPFLVSARYKRGTQPLLNAIRQIIDQQEKPKRYKDQQEESTQIALIGRPNAGKSSLINRLVGDERALTSEEAGTTRDSLDIPFTYNYKPYTLIDTAGIRRKTKIKGYLEVQSISRSIRAIERADIVLMVIDSQIGPTDQDTRLLNLAISRYKPTIIILNKWDLINNKSHNTIVEYQKYIAKHIIGDLSFVPVVPISCLENKRLPQVMKTVEMIRSQVDKRATTAKLNEAIKTIVEAHSPRIIKSISRRTKFYYATQISKKPTTIIIKCNVASALETSYKRFMLRQLRKALGFENIPLKIEYQDKKSEEKLDKIC